MATNEVKKKLLEAIFDSPAEALIESRNGLIDQADEEYRLIDGGGSVLIDWGKTFSAYAEEYEAITGESADTAHRDVTVIDAELARQWLREHVGRGELASYLVGDSGDRFAVKRDGSTYVSPSAGMEIAPEDRPIAWVQCKGIGNLDMTWWREDWECDDLDDTEVVWDCCENGDVSDELDDLIGKLLEDIDLDALMAAVPTEKAEDPWPRR